MHLRNAGQPRQILPMDTGKIVRILRYHLQQIVRRARHQVAFQHIGYPPHLALKGFKHLIGLARQRDFNENRGGPPQLSRIQQRHIRADDPLRLKPLYPPVTGRR